MRKIYDMYYNGNAGSMYGAYLEERPAPPAPTRRYETVTVPGRDGDLYIDDGSYDDITISVTLNFMSDHASDWGWKYRNVKSWILGDGDKKLAFQDDQSVYYKVKRATIKGTEREARIFGGIDVDFVCDPYTYLVSGDIAIESGTIINPTLVVSHPVYKITGEGMCTLTVNGKTMTANVGQNVSIDTDRQVAYKDDGTSQNAALTGDYEDLYLQVGSNTVSATDGFTVSIYPSWRTL